jgi:hypothetical protein
LPHPGRQALERDIYSWDRVAAEQLRLVAFEYSQRDAEEDVESVKEQDVPHAEKCLTKKREGKRNVKRIVVREGGTTYLDGETVCEEGEEPREADGGQVDAECCEVR